MRGWTAVFLREAREKVIVLPAAFVAGLLLLAFSLFHLQPLPLWSREDRFMAAAWVAGAFALVMSIVLGSSVAAKDISERRLGFYFSRPIQGPAIWWGKMAAGAVLVWISALLVMTPATLVLGIPPNLEPRWVMAMLGVVPLLLVSHGASLTIRSRLAVAPLNLVALALSAGAIWLAYRSVFRWLYVPGMIIGSWAIAAAGVATAVVFALAGRSSVARGRGDLHSGFLAFGRTLLVGLIGAVAVATAVERWYSLVGPAALDRVVAFGAPRGDVVYAAGRAPSRPGSLVGFLFHTATGTFWRMRVDMDWGLLLNPTFSRAGRRAAWFEWSDPDRGLFRDRSRNHAVAVADLSERITVRRSILVHPDETPYDLVLSEDGRRLAVVTYIQGAFRISVYSLDDRRILAVFDRPNERIRALRFTNPDQVTVLQGGVGLEVFDLRIDDRAAHRRCAIELPAEAYAHPTAWSADGRRTVLEVKRGRSDGDDPSEKTFRLVDLDDGRTLVAFEPPEDPTWRPTLLWDGRVAVAFPRPNGSELFLYSRDGELVRSYPTHFPIDDIDPSPAPSQIFLTSGNPFGESRLFLMNLESGNVRQVGGTLLPLGSHIGIQPRSPRETPEPGAPITRLFRTPEGRLIRLDPDTGAQTVLLGTPRKAEP